MPNIELITPNSIVPPPKCLVTRMGTSENAGLAKKLTSVAMTQTTNKPGQFHT